MLILIDNFEHLIAAAPQLVDLLVGAPETKFLVTSREPLRVSGENLCPVLPLEVADPMHKRSVEELAQTEAVRLFVERAVAARPDFLLTAGNVSAVVEIACRRLEGLPLAIELAATRVATYSPKTLLERMEQRLKLLTTGPQDVPERLQTMRNAIAWSHDLLDEFEKRLFRRLSVFAGGCTLEAAETVCGGEDDLGADLGEGLERLVAKNLLRVEEGVEARFGMLEVIREYGQERLAASGEADAVRQSHARYFLWLAGRARKEIHGPRGPSWLSRLDGEHDNLRTALTWALGSGDVALGMQLAARLAEFWAARGYYREGRAWLDRMLAAGKTVPEIDLAWTLSSAGFLASEQGDPATGRAFLQRALAMSREVEDEAITALALLYSANAALYLGDHASIRALTEEALPICERLGGGRLRAYALWLRGMAFMGEGDHDLARKDLSQSLNTYREQGDRRGVAQAQAMLGLVSAGEKAGAAGESMLHESLAVFRELGHRRWEAWALIASAILKLRRGDHPSARGDVGEALNLAADLGDSAGLSLGFMVWARLARETGERLRAARLLGGMWALAEDSGAMLQLAFIRSFREETVLSVRTGLGDGVFEAAAAEGRKMTADEATALALKNDLLVDAPIPTAACPKGSLSAREREVAALVAEGLSNREIGERLCLSNRTVESHLSSVMAKLGLKARAQVAAWITGHPEATGR